MAPPRGGHLPAEARTRLPLSFPYWLWPWSPLMIPYWRLIRADIPKDKGSLQSFSCLFSQHPSFPFPFDSPPSSLSISFSLLPVFSYSVFRCFSYFVSLLYIWFFFCLCLPFPPVSCSPPLFLLSPLPPFSNQCPPIPIISSSCFGLWKERCLF